MDSSLAATSRPEKASKEESAKAHFHSRKLGREHPQILIVS